MDDRLLFATDYPHWDFDAPDQAVSNVVPSELRRKIMAENARAFYRFSTDRSAPFDTASPTQDAVVY